MSVVYPFQQAESNRTLRVVEETERSVYWIHMHANLVASPGRACFSQRLVEQITEYQQELGARLRRENAMRRDTLLPHVVLASDVDVFNLGGDLELFCRLIRQQDRAALLSYARQCVLGVYAFYAGLNAGAHSIALVQGNALGGGFEAALSCHTIVAEEGVMMGLPEVLFDLFPGMGAYSFMCKRITPALAEKIMLEGNLYSAEELHQMGLVDIVTPKGEGPQAVEEIIRANRRIPHARAAMHQVRQLAQGVSLDELMRITEIWVDTAMQLGEKSLRTMDRLVRAQSRRAGADCVA